MPIWTRGFDAYDQFRCATPPRFEDGPGDEIDDDEDETDDTDPWEDTGGEA